MLPWILCGLLVTALIVCIIKLYMVKRSLDDICTEFHTLLSEDTNVLLSVSSGDTHVRRLAITINEELSKLRRLQRNYQKGDRALKESITNISHDLRTPLTAICGYLDLLEQQEHSEDVRRYLAQIRNRSEALKQLTEEFFRYSIVSSHTELTLTEMDLKGALEEALVSFYATFLQQGITPVIELPDTPVLRKLDSEALTRIFNNIISNAIRYGDGDFTVTLTEDGSIRFVNTAKSLSTVEVGKLFDRFYTVDSSRKSTGLGLSIAKLLTERMHGTISASYENESLCIFINFPE